MPRILIVDDEAGPRFTLTEILEDAGFEVSARASAAEALEVLGEADVVVTDLVMEGMDGLALLKRVKAEAPEVPVILVTARGSERAAVEALKAGAWDYQTKPFDLDALVGCVRRAAETVELRRSNRRLRTARAVGHDVVAESPQMRRLVDTAARLAGRDVTVLVQGETGTGKEVIGTLLHALGGRAEGPLVRFNCAAISAALAEAELFGSRKGAFTGADRDRPGYVTRADGGTLVLDEVGELPAPLQAKLLRVLQEGEVQPVGASRVERVDVRVVACTNRDLAAEVQAGAFRADLYYRLAVVVLEVPPLRQRPEDIPPLIEAFRRRYAREFGVDDAHFTPELLEALQRRPWPGNVRELDNAVARLIALSPGGPIGLEALGGAASAEAASATTARTYRAAMSAFERQFLQEAMDACGGNQSEAARRLEIARTTLIDKLKRHGLDGG